MKRFRISLRLALLLVTLASVLFAWLRVRHDFQRDEARREIERIASQSELQFSHQRRLLREYAEIKHSAQLDQQLSWEEIELLNNAFTLYQISEVTPIPAAIQAELEASKQSSPRK